MGCLLAEFKLTAMLFGGGRWGDGGGCCGLVAAAFWGLSPLHSPPLLPHFHFPLESRGGEKHGAFLRAGIVLSGGRLIFLLGNMLPCEAE